jgi:hypothetical protein
VRSSRPPGKHQMTHRLDGVQNAMRFERHHAVLAIGPSPFHFFSCA